jgi:hypothetical protein
LLFPHADLGIYTGELDKHLKRTVYTNTQNFAVVFWWVISLLVAAIQRDRKTVVIGLILGAGFGFGFLQSALWCLGYKYAPGYIDWWKMWELNAGFNLGILYIITLFWAIQQVDRTYGPDGIPRFFNDISASRPFRLELYETLFLAFAGSLLVFLAGFEYFFWTVIFLSLFFFVALVVTTRGMGKDLDTTSLADRRQNVLLIYSIFLLVFLLFHGGSERAGIFLELYTEEAVDQYAWPVSRIILFTPVALVIVGATFLKMREVFRNEITAREQTPLISKLPVRMVDLMTVIGFIGALSIWPAKIGVLYAMFLFLAIFAFNRLYHRYEDI